MKAITLKQPWASLVAEGAKKIETRTHSRFKNLVGQRIAIHAGKTFELLPLGALREDHVKKVFKGSNKPLPNGAIVCTAFVKEVRMLTDEDSYDACCPAAGKFGLILTDVQKVDPPVPARGYQGIWEWIN